MNKKNYLHFFFLLVKENLIEDVNKISKFSKNKKLSDTQTFKKKISIQKAIAPIELENKDILLIDDLPINFLISHTILLGDLTELLKFNIENKKENYIATRKVYDLIKKNYKTSNIKQINPTDLKDMPFKPNPNTPKVLVELKKYIKEKKNLDLNTLHLINADTLKNFVPTIKESHFKLAKKMKLPIVSLIENKFLRETSIHVDDFLTQTKLIDPLFKYSIKGEWDFDKETEEQLCKDLSSELNLIIDKQTIYEKLLEIPTTNINKEEYKNKLKNLKKIELSAPNGKIPIPLWKSKEKQEYIIIKDEKEFEKKCGRPFEIDIELFSEIFMQTLSGEKAYYKERYLKPQLQYSLTNLENAKTISFRRLDELICKLIFCPKIENLICTEELNENKIEELKKIIKSMIKKTTVMSIKYNKIPNEIEPKTILERYYSSVSNTLYTIYEKYKEKPSKKELIAKTLKKTNLIMQTIKQNKCEFEHLYFYIQIILVQIKILATIDPYLANKYHELLQSYYENHKYSIQKNKINIILEDFIEDVTFANKLSKKRNVYFVTKKEFDKTIFNDKIMEINYPKIIKKIIKPNYPLLKRLFPYSVSDISVELKSLDPLKIKTGTKITIKGREIEIKKEYYEIYEVYSNYKQLLENEYFKLLLFSSTN